MVELLPSPRFPEAFTQLIDHRLQTRRRLGGGLDVIVNLGRFPHRFPAYRQPGVVDLGSHRGGNRAQLESGQ